MKVASRFWCVGGAAALGLGLATAARADNSGSTSVSSTGQLALGTVFSAPSGVTVFRVNPQTGGVSVVSGSGSRSAGGGDPRALVTVACGKDTKCASDEVRIRIGSINLETGRGQPLSNFTVQMNSAVLASGSSPAAGNPVDFTIRPIGRGGSKTFYLGADFPILGDNASSSSTATAQFYVYAGFASAVPTSGSTGGLATATVTRALTLSASGELNFGALFRPASGTGTAVVDADQGLYHNVNITAAAKPGPSRVLFTATGDPNRAISVTIPHDFKINGPGGSNLDVTLSSNAGSGETLNGSGSYTFGVGGSINVSNTTLTGVYTGTFTVTVAYD